MLQQNLPDELDDNLVRATTPRTRVAWKTGTSTGHCDAWAFVFNRQYVVGVWLGNNDGRRSKRLVGAEAALPLAARIFRALPPSDAPEWPEEDGDLRTVTVCALSGLPASPWCKKTRVVKLPGNQYLHRLCDVHYPAPGGVNTVTERWPGAAKGWDLARIQAPKTVLAKKLETRREALRILAPSDKGEYVLTGEAQGDLLRMKTSLDAESPLHWYMDDQYLGVSTPETPLAMALNSGGHRLVCMTPQGTTDAVQFTVSEPLGARPHFARR